MSHYVQNVVIEGEFVQYLFSEETDYVADNIIFLVFNVRIKLRFVSLTYSWKFRFLINIVKGI